MRAFKLFCILLIPLAACQSAIPDTINGNIGTEFTLAPSQTVVMDDAGLSIQLVGVGGDERCPSQIECAVSRPVALTISVQKDTNIRQNLDLQTFTSNDGRAPEMPFEGIQSQVEYEGYIIRVTGVLPYPSRSFNEIKAFQYRISFVVTEN